MPKKVMIIYGTRPEAIKVAPVIREIQESASLQSVTVVTGQHREMLDQVNSVFDITPDYDLNVFAPGQGLNALMAKVFDRLDSVLARVSPDAVLVQGDTSTVAAATIAAFYRKVPVFHLEAGLRSGDINSPFPEEANRKIASQISALHFAPTRVSRVNLLHEGVADDDIVVTGNTVIDALIQTSQKRITFSESRLEEAVSSARKIILVTAHRRESWGVAMEGIGRAIGRIATTFPEYLIVLPVHRNPLVREAIMPHVERKANVLITEPLPYGEFTQLLGASSVVLTDSGGVQEEAPSLGKPVLVMRDNTERPEAVEAGAVRLIGTDEDRIVQEVERLIRDPEHYRSMSDAVNPYGDGQAAARVRASIEQFFGVGIRLPDFQPAHLSGSRT